MHRNVSLAWLVIVCGIIFIGAPAFAAEKKKTAAKPDAAAGTVEKVLRAEVAGVVDRRDQLADTLKQQPDSSVARWQAGFVRDGDSWRPFDGPAGATKASELLDLYRLRRHEVPQTFRGQLDLANWCDKQGLKDQERAHLSTALFLAAEADRARLLKRLGFQEVGGRWLSREQLVGWQQLNRRTERAIQKWGARIERIADRVDGSPRQHDVAMASLSKLTDPDAIPAIQYVLSGRNEACAEAAVDAFAQTASCEATVALTQAGVFSKWPKVRQQATTELKTRRFEDFVPALASLLTSRIVGGSTDAQIVMLLDRPYEPSQSGFVQFVLLLNFVMARETDDQFQVASIQSADYRINALLRGHVVSVDNGFQLDVGTAASSTGASDLTALRVLHDAARLSGSDILDRQRLIAELNDRTDELNQRVADVLAGVTGRTPDPEPGVWWKWWTDYSDLQQAGSKPVVVSEDSEIVGDPGMVVARCSCFAAGTPVWTESGAQPIETIKIGDRVLSKDVDTGELAYMPVLQTTVRPPKELTTLRFGDETIVCTGGHRFWSSGSGWIKARDLAPQTLLHTATGNTPVWSAKKGSTAETYNLVVADFHTYFVGKTGVLCQDLLIPKGTNSVVPGLSRAHATAQK